MVLMLDDIIGNFCFKDWLLEVGTCGAAGEDVVERLSCSMHLQCLWIKEVKLVFNI